MILLGHPIRLVTLFTLSVCAISVSAKERGFSENDPQLSEYKTVVGLIYDKYRDRGRCAFIKADNPPDASATKTEIFGECILENASICVSDAGRKRCFDGLVKMRAFGADFHKKKPKAKIKWNAYFFLDQEKEQTLVQFIYRFSKKSGNWEIQSITQGIVFDFRKNRPK